GNINSLEKTVEKWHSVIEEDNWLLPIHERKSAKSYLDWIGQSLIRHKDTEILRMTSEAEPINQDVYQDKSNWQIEIMHASELNLESDKQVQASEEISEAIQEWKPIKFENEDFKLEVNNRLDYTYPYSEAVNTRAKQSVTEIKRQQEIEDVYSSQDVLKPIRQPITKRPLFMQEKKELTAAEKKEYEYRSQNILKTIRQPITKRPLFMQEKKELTADEKRTAMHAVMQYLPFNHKLTKQEITKNINEMEEKSLILPEAVKTIDIDAIERFFQTELASKMINSTNLEKEIPFMYTQNTSNIYQHWQSDTDEKVVVQGIIDCLFEYENEWYIVDYKTDVISDEFVTDETITELKERYMIQINLYQQAIESILKRKVKKSYLYFFDKEIII